MTKRLRAIISFMLVAMLVVSMLPISAMAAEDYFTFADGVLTITSDMPDYDSPEATPWASYRDQITKVEVLGDWVWYVGQNAFAGCTNLQQVVIDCEIINGIGDGAFRGCTSLEEVDLGSAMTTIRPYAFADCTALTTLEIPANIRSIGYGAFQGCSNLEDIYIYSRNVQYPTECIDEENWIYSNAATIPETAEVHCYPFGNAYYYCANNDRPYTMLTEGLGVTTESGDSTYAIGYDNDYLANLWAASAAENGSADSINFDYDIHVDADALCATHDGMVDSSNQMLFEGNNTSGELEVQVMFSVQSEYSSNSMSWYATYRFEPRDMAGNLNDDYKQWIGRGDQPYVSFSSSGKDLSIHVEGSFADMLASLEAQSGEEIKAESAYISVYCRGISHYRGSNGREYDRKTTYIEGASASFSDVHQRFVECDSSSVITMKTPFTVVDYPPEGNAGYLEPTDKNYTWQYRVTRYGQYLDELGRMLGDMYDVIDPDATEGNFLEEYEGVTYGTVMGTFDAGNDPSICFRDILTQEQIPFVESLAGLEAYGEYGQQVMIQLYCTVTLTYADGTVIREVGFGDEGTAFAGVCLHTCAQCGMCSAEQMLSCNSRWGERVLECICESPSLQVSYDRIPEQDITFENQTWAGELSVIVEQIDLNASRNSQYVRNNVQSIGIEKVHAMFDISVFDGEMPYQPNEWGGQDEKVIITLPVSDEIIATIENGDVGLFHINQSGGADQVNMSVDAENNTITFVGTQFSPYVLADTVSYYGRNALMAMEKGEKYVTAYDAILFYLEDSYSGDEQVTIWVDGYEEALTEQELAMVIDVFRRDHPEYFWIADEYTAHSYDGEIAWVYLYMELLGQDRTDAVRELKNAANQILSGITEDMSQYEKALYLHDALAAHVTYEDGENAHNIYGALVEGKAVCDGYAEAYQYLLREAGIQSYIAVGTGNGEAHAWNYVRMDGKYSLVDVTWDDQGEELYHAYFGLTDAMIAEDHTANAEGYALPVSNTLDAFYFNQKPEYLDSYTVNSVGGLFADQGMKIHVYVPGDVSAFTAWLQSNIGQIAGMAGVTESFSYGYSMLGHELILKINSGKVAAVVSGDTVTQYRTVQAAANACTDGAYVRLLEDVEENLTLQGNLYLDLNGNDLSGTMTTNGYKVYGMDSATNQYSSLKMGYFSCTDSNGNSVIPEALYTTANSLRYMAIETEQGYTFRRFYVGITHLSLSPAVVGFGYKAQFYGDSVVQGQIASIGYNLWITENCVVTRNTDFQNQLTLLLKNIDGTNYGETPIYASATVTLKDGTVIEGATVSYTLRQVVELAVGHAEDLTADQLAAVEAMIAANPIMQTWDVANLSR